ncbi:MAG: glycosyltransferase family 39 protein [Bacteroidales bacterium]|nr:glycosyltransferase family 39 protein [Bacteroidales bacterium]
MNHIRYILILKLIAAIFLELWRIGQAPVEEWDEARRGINAMGMVAHSDFFSYHFVDQADLFNTKPPLTVWLIALNFKIFGVTAFALRFHSVIAIFFFLIYMVKIILLYRDELFAVIFMGILISVKGIIGFHVGRTGDTDSLLLLFLTGFVYYFLKYWDFDNRRSVYFSAIFFGLAFFTKGVASFIILPSVLAYMLITKRKRFFNADLIFSVLIVLTFMISWGLINQLGNHPAGHGSDLWYRSFSNDLFRRLTDRSFEAGYDPFHIIHVLDMNLNIWNYLLYIGGIIGLYRLILLKKTGELLKDNLLLISLLIGAGYFIILTISINKHRWYLAPALPFIIILIAEFILFIRKRYSKILVFVFIGIALLTLKRFIELNDQNTSARDFFAKFETSISGAEKLYVNESVSQDLIFDLIKYNYKNAVLVKEFPPDDSNFLYFGPVKENAQADILGCLGEDENLVLMVK